MSDVQKGARRVRAVEDQLHRLGFRTAIISRSGQRRGARRESLALDGDLVALAPSDSEWPHLVIEVGGRSKSVRQSIAEMTELELPAGFVPIVVRLVDARTRRREGGWRWHAAAGDAYTTPSKLLEALRS